MAENKANPTKKNVNYAVVRYTGNFYKGDGECYMYGIYPTHRAAMFISRCVKRNEKLKFYPKVIESTNEPTSTTVEAYLDWAEEQEKKNAAKKDSRKREKSGSSNSQD
tara:strand:+ start:10179 stop:10502 length:324 start_codon:yes stop_codon:yes gene_type:complete